MNLDDSTNCYRLNKQRNLPRSSKHTNHISLKVQTLYNTHGVNLIEEEILQAVSPAMGHNYIYCGQMYQDIEKQKYIHKPTRTDRQYRSLQGHASTFVFFPTLDQPFQNYMSFLIILGSLPFTHCNNICSKMYKCTWSVSSWYCFQPHLQLSNNLCYIWYKVIYSKRAVSDGCNCLTNDGLQLNCYNHIYRSFTSVYQLYFNLL